MKYVADGWGITIGHIGFVFGGGIYETKSEAIYQFVGASLEANSWPQARRIGYRCVRVYRGVPDVRQH